MKKFKLVLLFSAIILCSCKNSVQESEKKNGIENPNDLYTKVMSSFFEASALQNNNQYYLLIPISGCHGCVDALLRELEKDTSMVRNSTNISIIFTEFSTDHKVNKAKLGSFYSHGFHYDSTNHLAPLFSFVRAPLLLLVNDEKVVNSDTLSASEVNKIKVYF